MLEVLPSTPVSLSLAKKRRRKSKAGRKSAKKAQEQTSDATGSEPPDPHEQRKIKVVIIHGDPSKPNSILPGGKWDEDDFQAAESALKALNTLDGYEFSVLCNHDTLMDDLRRLKAQGKVDLVLQFCDEGWMNNCRMEMHICALLEMCNIPYSGSGPACIGVTYDKQLVLNMAASIGIPVPKTVYIESENMPIDLKGLHYPVIVKPNSTDGSFGITKKNVCRNETELYEAIRHVREVFKVHCALLIQEFLEGRDVNCAIIGNPPDKYQVLPITEEDYSALPPGWPRICGFESKWDPESPYWNIKTVPTTLDAEKQKMIADCSARLFHRLGVRDYARFDWRLDQDGNPRLLEANPNCGWCDDGHMAKTAALAGISYPQMLKMIIDAALLRAQRGAEPPLSFVDLKEVRDPH
jgi:D-alanine-D-alanine ligase